MRIAHRLRRFAGSGLGFRESALLGLRRLELPTDRELFRGCYPRCVDPAAARPADQAGQRALIALCCSRLVARSSPPAVQLGPTSVLEPRRTERKSLARLALRARVRRFGHFGSNIFLKRGFFENSRDLV